MIHSTLTRQQSHVVQYFFINSQSLDQASLRVCASLHSQPASFCTRLAKEAAMKQVVRQADKAFSRLPVSYSQWITYQIHASALTPQPVVQRPTRRIPEQGGGGIGVNLLGWTWRWPQTFAGDCWQIWSAPGAPGLLWSRASAAVPGIKGRAFAWKVGHPVLLLKVASSHTSWMYWRYYWEREKEDLCPADIDHWPAVTGRHSKHNSA